MHNITQNSCRCSFSSRGFFEHFTDLTSVFQPWSYNPGTSYIVQPEELVDDYVSGLLKQVMKQENMLAR